MKILVTTISAAFAVFAMTSCVANKGNFLLINKAKEPISQALVTVCGQTIELRDIQPGISEAGSYEVKSDSHYDVRIKFQSGKKLQKGVGYVTNGLDFHHDIVITDTNIEMVSDKIKAQ
ncbi:MAG: hypothetical protein DID92_2727743295 [Candidatus Nitrotoga sp. SPKER]|nr:MAG: hypothetical protein DID92_2727743295 [Candidatus Nitrotoga sp. SPKER]